MLELDGRMHDLSARALVMGILNRTPDSFHQHHYKIDDALRRVEQIATEGGHIVDVGGVKAGAGPEVSISEEIERVCPVVAAVADRCDLAISVDTFRAEVAQAAIGAGAHMINDISGLTDPGMAEVVARHGVAAVVTHIQGRPRVPHPEPVYGNLVADVRAQLESRLAVATAAGISPTRLLVDPGLDLGKTYPQSMVLLRELAALGSLGHVILLSASHKGFLGGAAPLKVDQRHEASLAAVAYGFTRGARVMRVHAVEATTRVCETMSGVMTAQADDPWTSRLRAHG
jgi:dihydropteroate synthase